MQAFFLLLESATAFSLFNLSDACFLLSFSSWRVIQLSHASFLSPPGECYSFLSLQSEWCKLSFSSWRVLQLSLYSIWVMQAFFLLLERDRAFSLFNLSDACFLSPPRKCYSLRSFQSVWCKLSFSSWREIELTLSSIWVMQAFFLLLKSFTAFSLFNLSDASFLSPPYRKCYSFLSLQSEWCSFLSPSGEWYSFLSLQSEWCKLSFSS